MIEMPKLTFVPAQPANLPEVLKAQIRRLIEVGAPKEVGVNEEKFLDDAMELVGILGNWVFGPFCSLGSADQAVATIYRWRPLFFL